jgi:NitT/TauT family transport system ATP-binding protein
MNTMKPQIQIRNASGMPAMGPISIDIAENEFIAILGPAGCGKTTLLKMIAGIKPVETGEILHAEKEPGSEIRVGVVLHDLALLSWRTVLQNVLLPAEIHGCGSGENMVRARRLLAWFGLSPYENHKVHKLSEGMKPAVAICRALFQAPRALLLDEPFGGLEPLIREKMADLFQRLWLENRTTTLMCTTNILEAVLLSDRIAVLSPRPARLIEILDIDLPRPRRLDRTTSLSIAEFCSRIRTLFRAHGVLP